MTFKTRPTRNVVFLEGVCDPLDGERDLRDEERGLRDEERGLRDGERLDKERLDEERLDEERDIRDDEGGAEGNMSLPKLRIYSIILVL